MSEKFKIFYAEDLEDLREMYAISLEAEFDCEVVEFGSGNDLIAAIKENNDISLILCDHNMPNGTGSDVYRHLKSIGNPIPFALISSDDLEAHAVFKSFKADHSLNFYMQKPFPISELFINVEKVLSAVKRQKIGEYVPLKVSRLEKMNPLPMNVYIKGEDNRFIKILNCGDLYSEEHYGKHQEKYGKFYYIQRNSYELFIADFIAKLKGEVKNIQHQLDSLALAHELANGIGVDSGTIELVDAIADAVIKNLTNNKNLLSDILLQSFDGSSYLHTHSLLLGYLCCSVAQNSGWGSANYLQKLVNASLLHDLGLDPELAKIDTLVQVVTAGISWQNGKKITEHPQLTLELLKKGTNLESDVEQIISSHHERPNGKGFPRGLTAFNTPPLVCLFIIAEEITSHLITNGSNRSLISSKIKSMEDEYGEGNYEKSFAGLKLFFGD